MSLAFWLFLIIWSTQILVSRYTGLTTASFSEMSKFESISRLHPSRNPECPSRFTKGDDNSNEEFLSRPSIEVRAILAPCHGIFGKKFSYNFDSERNYEERLHDGIRNCSRKIIISLKFNNVGKTKTQEKFMVIDHALDSFTMEKISLRNPYVIKVRQRPVLQLYGLKFQGVVNAEATEEVIDNKNPNFKGCNDSDNPTCGRMFVHGKPVPFSEGFCCSCDPHVNLERQTGKVSNDSFESFNDGAKLNYGNGTNKPRNRLQTETAWTNSLDNSMARRQIDVAETPSKNKSIVDVERHANPDGYRVTKSFSTSYNSVGRSPRKEEIKAPRTLNRSKNDASRVFREEVKFRDPKSVVVEEISRKKADLSTKSMQDSSTEAFRENMINEKEKLIETPKKMDVRDDFSFRGKESVKFRDNEEQESQIDRNIFLKSSTKLPTLTERKHRNFKSDRFEKSSKNGKLVSLNDFSKKNSREGMNNKSRRRMVKKILDFPAPRTLGVVFSTERATLKTQPRKATFRDGFLGEKRKILGKDPPLEPSTEKSLLQSNKRKVQKKVFPASLRTYSSTVPTTHLNEPFKNSSTISSFIHDYRTYRKHHRRTVTISNIIQTTTKCSLKNLFANETIQNTKKKKNILKRVPKNEYYFHEPIENRSPRILTRAVSDFSRNESLDGKESIENSPRNEFFAISTPQKRTLKDLTYRNDYDLWRTVTRRRDSRKNNKKNRSSVSKDNLKHVSGRSRRFNEMLAKGTLKYRGNKGKKIMEKLNDVYPSHDRQVFIDDYYEVEKNHPKTKSEDDKFDVGKVGVHRLIQNGGKNEREETMDDLFLRNETNGRDVDKQIEQKFVRISNALREDAMEPRVIGDEIKDATDKVETSYEITRVEESSSEFNEFDFFYGRDNESTTKGFATAKEIILGDERLEVDTTTLNLNFVTTEKAVKNLSESNFSENLFLGTSDNDMTLEGKDYDNNYTFTSTTSSSSPIGRPVLIVETLKISRPKFKQTSDSDSQNLLNTIKTTIQEPISTTIPPPIVIKCFKTTATPIPRYFFATTLKRISKSQSTLEKIEETSTKMTLQNLSMTRSMEKGVEKYTEITTTLSAIDLTENLASLSEGSTREENETSESTIQTTRITDETFRASIKPLGEATGRTSPGAEFHDEIFIDDTTFPDETDAPTTTDQAKIREVFLQFEGDRVDSGIGDSFDGDFGYNDVRGMKKIVQTNEKTDMDDEAKIGEEFFNFDRDQSDSEVEGDFGEVEDDDNEETREISGVKMGNNDFSFRKNAKGEEYSRDVDSKEEKNSDFVFESKNIDLIEKRDSKGSYMRENQNYIGLSMNEGQKMKEKPKDLSSLKKKYVGEEDFEKINNNNFEEERTVFYLGRTTPFGGTTDFRKQRKENHPWFRTIEPAEFTLKRDFNFNHVTGSKSPILSSHKTAKASKELFSFQSSPGYGTEEQTGRILPACGGTKNHKRSFSKKIIPTDHRKTGRRLLSIKNSQHVKKVHRRKTAKKKKKNIDSSKNKVKFKENHVAAEERVKRTKDKNNRISKKRHVAISGVVNSREEAKDRRKKQSTSEEDYFDGYDYLIPEEPDGERINERRAKNVENPEDIFANYEMITASNEPLGANVEESKMENTLDDLYNGNSPMAIEAEKFEESFKGDNSQPRSNEVKASRDSSFRGDRNEGKDFEISLKGKVHLDTDSSGRSMSINFDAIPTLLEKDTLTNNGYVNQFPENSGIETNTVAPEIENVNFLTNFNPVEKSEVLPVQNSQENFGASKIIGGEDLRKKESGIPSKLLAGSPELEEGGSMSERHREFPNFPIYKLYDGFNRNTNRLNRHLRDPGSMDFLPEDAVVDVDEEDGELEDDSLNSENKDRVKMSGGSNLRKKISLRSANDLVTQSSISFPDIFENLFTNEEPEDGSEISKNSKVVVRDSNSRLKSGCYRINSTVRTLHVPESTSIGEEPMETTVDTFNFSNRDNSNEPAKETRVFNENIESFESTTVRGQKESRKTTIVESTTIDYRKNLSEPSHRSSKMAIKSAERKNALAIEEFVKKLLQLAKNNVSPPCTSNCSNDTVIHHERMIIVPWSRSSWTGKPHDHLHPSLNSKDRIKKQPKHLTNSNNSKEQLNVSKQIKKSISSILNEDPKKSDVPEKPQENAYFQGKLIKIMSPTGATSSSELSKGATSSSSLKIPSSKESPCHSVENEIRKSTGSSFRTGANNIREKSLLFGKPEEQAIGSNIAADTSSEEGSSGKKDTRKRPAEATNVAKVTKESFIEKDRRNNEKSVLQREPNGEQEDVAEDGSGGSKLQIPFLRRPERGGVSKRDDSLRYKNSKKVHEGMSDKSKGLKREGRFGKSDSFKGKLVKLGEEEIRESARVGLHGDDRGRRERSTLEGKSRLLGGLENLDGDPVDYLSPGKYRVDEEIRDREGQIKGRRERRRSRKKKKRRRKKKKKKGKRSTEGANIWREWPLKRNLLMVFQEEDIPIATSRGTSERDIPVEEFRGQFTKQNEKKREDSRNNADIGKSQTRGGQNCMSRKQPSKVESPKYFESAHCLRFSDLWYSVYQLEEPQIDHEVYLQVYEKRSLPNGTISWIDLTMGSMIRLGTHDGYYKNHEDTIAITYNEGRLTCSRGYSLDSRRDRLLVPFSLTGNKLVSPEIQGWSDEYLVVDAKKINENGKECDKAGVSFAAFAGQPSRCERVRGSCLKNQPLAYWRHDTEARESGRGGCYFLSNFAPVPSEAIKYNVNGSGSREFLALEYHSPHVSVIDVELQADYNTPPREGLSGCIAEVHVDNTALDYTIIMLVIINEGSTSSSYKPRIVDCPPGLPVAWRTAEGPAKLILPHRNRKVTLKLYGSLPIDEFCCTVNLLNQRGESVAKRRIKIRKMDRCFCIWHCLCTCSSDNHKMACRPMSLENYYAAGFRGPIPIETFIGSSTLSEPINILLLFLIILLLLLLLMGLLKWAMGICIPSVSLWGLDVLLDRGGMGICSEDSRNSEKFPKIVRICNRKLEFFLNLTFFLVYPFGICLRHCKKTPVSFGGRDTVESKMSLRSERDDPPRMICLSTYGDSVNSTMEAEDTRYVIEELKKSQDSLRRHSENYMDHDRGSEDPEIVSSTQVALLFQRNIRSEKTYSSSD